MCVVCMSDCLKQGERARMLDVAQLPSENAPKGGMGDCAAPKLLNYANSWSLIPEAIAETWIHPHNPTVRSDCSECHDAIFDGDTLILHRLLPHI